LHQPLFYLIVPSGVTFHEGDPFSDPISSVSQSRVVGAVSIAAEVV